MSSNHNIVISSNEDEVPPTRGVPGSHTLAMAGKGGVICQFGHRFLDTRCAPVLSANVSTNFLCEMKPLPITVWMHVVFVITPIIWLRFNIQVHSVDECAALNHASSCQTLNHFLVCDQACSYMCVDGCVT